MERNMINGAANNRHKVRSVSLYELQNRSVGKGEDDDDKRERKKIWGREYFAFFASFETKERANEDEIINCLPN